MPTPEPTLAAPPAPPPAAAAAPPAPEVTYIIESGESRKTRCRKLFKKCLSDRHLEHCEMPELLRWMDEEQARHGARYRPWNADEVWDVLEQWAEEEDESGVMVERAAGEIFSL